jgi:lipopolysaccharide biosynthesis regulator YciM
MYKDDYETAITAFIRVSENSEDHKRNAYQNLAFLYERQKDMTKADRFHRRAVKEAEDSRDPEIANVYWEYGMLLIFMSSSILYEQFEIQAGKELGGFDTKRSL